MKKRNHARAPDKVGFSVALPKNLADSLRAIAKRETRNRNQQIQKFLEDAVAEWQKHHGNGLRSMEQSPEKLKAVGS